MRVLIVMVVLVLILALVGWVQFGTPDGDPTIQVDMDQVRQDTSEIVEQSKRVVDKAAEEVDASIDHQSDEVESK